MQKNIFERGLEIGPARKNLGKSEDVEYFFQNIYLFIHDA